MVGSCPTHSGLNTRLTLRLLLCGGSAGGVGSVLVALWTLYELSVC